MRFPPTPSFSLTFKCPFSLPFKAHSHFGWNLFLKFAARGKSSCVDYPSVGIVNGVCQQYIKEFNPKGHRASSCSKVKVWHTHTRSVCTQSHLYVSLQQSYKVISTSACSLCKIAVARCLHESLAVIGKRCDVQIAC